VSLALTEITATFDDGSGAPASGYVTFTPSETVYASGVPVVSVDSPITVQVNAGVLGSVELLATDNSGLSYIGQTGFFYWTVQVVVNNITQAPWSFFLPSSPDTVDLFSLANTGAGGGGSGTVTSVAVESANGFAGTVADDTTTPQITLSTSITGLIKGNGTALEEATAGTDYLTPSGSGADLTGITATQVGADASGAAATAQANAETYAESLQPTSESPLALTDGGTGVSAANDAALLSALGAAPLASPALTGTPTAPTASGGTDTTQIATTAFAASAAAAAQSAAEDASVSLDGDTMGGYLAPAVTALSDGDSVSINAADGNDFTWSLGGSSHTLGAPSNPTAGQKITIEIDYSGSYTPEFATGSGAFDFGGAGEPSWTAASGKNDVVAFRYSAVASMWQYLGAGLGYTS